MGDGEEGAWMSVKGSGWSDARNDLQAYPPFQKTCTLPYPETNFFDVSDDLEQKKQSV